MRPFFKTKKFFKKKLTKINPKLRTKTKNVAPRRNSHFRTRKHAQSQNPKSKILVVEYQSLADDDYRVSINGSHYCFEFD